MEPFMGDILCNTLLVEHELKNILHHQDFQQVESIIDRYRQDIDPNQNRANMLLF